MAMRSLTPFLKQASGPSPWGWRTEWETLVRELHAQLGAGCAHAGLVGWHPQLASGPGEPSCVCSLRLWQCWLPALARALREPQALGAAVAFKTFAHLYLHHSFIHVFVHLTHLMRVSKALGTFPGFGKRGVTFGSPVILKQAMVSVVRKQCFTANCWLLKLMLLWLFERE